MGERKTTEEQRTTMRGEYRNVDGHVIHVLDDLTDAERELAEARAALERTLQEVEPSHCVCGCHELSRIEQPGVSMWRCNDCKRVLDAAGQEVSP